MQIYLDYINALLAQWYDYILQNPLNGAILTALTSAVVIWLLLKIYYRIQLKKLGTRLGKDIAAKEQERVLLNQNLETVKQQFQQAEADLSAKNNQIEQLEHTGQALQVQVDQINRVKALIIQASQTLQTTIDQNAVPAIYPDNNVETLWQNYSAITIELNQRLKSSEQKNFELQLLNQQGAAKLVEQETSIVGLQESVKNQTAQLTHLREDFEAQQLKLHEQQLKQESDQLLIQQLTQKSIQIQDSQKVIPQPLETVTSALKLQTENTETIALQKPAMESDANAIIPDAVELVTDAGDAIAADTAESFKPAKKQAFQFFKTLKKTLHTDAKPVLNEIETIATETVKEEAISETDNSGDQPATNRLQDEIEHVQHAVSETVGTEPVEKTASFSKLKGFFGTKKSSAIDNAGAIDSHRNEREDLTSSEAEPKAEEKLAAFTKFKNVFGIKKSSDESVTVTERQNVESVAITNEDAKKTGTFSKLQGFLGKKSAVLDSAEDIQEQVNARSEKLSKPMQEETHDVTEKLGEPPGSFKGFLRVFKMTK